MAQQAARTTPAARSAQTADATPTARPAAAPATQTAPAAGRAAGSGATLAVTSAVTAVALMNYTAPMLTIPGLTASFSTPVGAQAWLINGTPLGLAALLLVAGSLADDYGRRRLFLIGTFGLALTIALGAMAPTTLTFTLARAAQGAATAAVLASSLGLLVHAFPAGSARIRATGVWGAFVSAGIAVGPLLAGLLAPYGWRLTYGVLAAATLAGAIVAARTLTESRAPRGGRPDLAGAAALGLAFTSLVSALTLGRDGWLRAPVGLLLLAAVVLAAVFVAVERRTATPLIDLRLLRRPEFLASTAGALFTGLAVIGLFSFLPALLQQALGISPLTGAWLFVLWSGTGFLVALQARRLADRVQARHQLAIGFALHAVGVLTMLGAVGAGSLVRLLPGLFIAGVGSGLLNAALPRVAVGSVPPERAAMGSGANNTARYIGSSIGVALVIAVAPAGSNAPLLVSAGLTALGVLSMLLLRPRH
ncbi:MFS transporter [Streptomyces sp. NBC_01306]|uniref:MFS transporter n=1 Tax=Streptomyces sp. NBC_01306 TaxID=2903819 RepID=UPI002256FFC2|nr:MFS transporter [Streptomyces sp. NBC_01306]MCX4726378.1 MFS transporter [Streptomyces sp. NBC_01306]